MQIDRDALQRVVAVINGKGGVGKTSLVANIGGLCAVSGMKVLLVDMDPQGNLEKDLGYGDKTDGGAGLAQTLLWPGILSPIQIRENLAVIPGGPALHDALAALSAKTARDPDGTALALADALQTQADEYDLVLVDCPPGSEALQTAAMAAARYIIIPVRADDASVDGLSEVSSRLNAVLRVNETLDLLGVVLFGVEISATRVKQEVTSEIASILGDPGAMFDTVIRHSSAVARRVRRDGLLAHELEAHVAAGPSWWQIRRKEAATTDSGPRTASSVAEDYQRLTQEIITRLTNKEAAA